MTLLYWAAYRRQELSSLTLKSFDLDSEPRNPFDEVTVGTTTNDSRKLFIPRDVVAKVIDA